MSTPTSDAPKERTKRRKGSTRIPRGSEELRDAWFEFNGVTPLSLYEYCPKLLQLAEDFRYIHWPWSIRNYVTGKDIVDLGCGKSLHAIGYLMSGVRSYTGLDPIVELDRDMFKDTRIARENNFRPIGWTPRKISRRLPRIRYRQSLIGNLKGYERWDVLIMHNVSEHLMQIEDVWKEIPGHLREDGILLFSHPSFYAWSGHHMSPRSIADIDPNDAEQKRYMDWAHLTFDPTWPETIIDRQNRIRLHELKALTEKYFEILEWKPIQSTEKEGAGRWNDNILKKHPEFTKEELLTHRVFCVARKKR